jgi:hypothetical protein
MERVIELPLKTPLELRIVEVPRVQVEVIGVDRNALVLELDDDLDAFALGARVEIKQRMLVEPQLGEHAIKPNTFTHTQIVEDRAISVLLRVYRVYVAESEIMPPRLRGGAWGHPGNVQARGLKSRLTI